jgi:hypothetical protein
MSKIVSRGLVILALAATPSLASAGWVIEWKNTPIRKDVPQDSEFTTAYVSRNKGRMEQPHVTTVYDYDKSTFTMMNPKAKFFWTGGIEEYVKLTAKRRDEALRKSVRAKKDGEIGELPEVDVETLPEITIQRSGEQRQIAGYDTVKYVVHVNEELFQELFVAEGLDLTADLDPKKFVAYQLKNSRGMIGGSSKPYQALYRDPGYLDMLKKGFVLETLTHHIAGGFQQTAQSIKQVDVDPATFAAPAEYRRVQLDDVLQIEPE